MLRRHVVLSLTLTLTLVLALVLALALALARQQRLHALLEQIEPQPRLG